MEKSSRRVDRRVERSKAAVLEETYRQLSQSGLAGVSIDEVARVSGVSKTTIYRHWPTRSALLIDACSRLGGPREVPDTGSVRGDVRALTAALANQLQTANWSSVYPSIIDATERDASIAAMQAAWHKELMTPLHEVIERGRNKGEIRSEVPANDLVARIVGPLFYRRWFSKEPIDDRFVNAIVDAALTAVAYSTTPAGSAPVGRR